MGRYAECRYAGCRGAENFDREGRGHISFFEVGSFNSKLGCLGYKGQCMPVMNTATCRVDINCFIT
jgi:hypothetical protein